MSRMPALGRFAFGLPVLATLMTLGTAPAFSQDQAGMDLSDEARTAFRAEIRAYLMENPEVIFEAVAEYERRTQAAQDEMDNTLVELNAEELFADSHSYVGGNPNGSLTLVEFMDYRCGFCRRAHPERNAFLDTDGDVRLVIKEFPILGPSSEMMSRFAVAVQQTSGDEHYYEAHERLIGWDGDFTETSARLLAGELGVEAQTVLDAMNSDEVTAILRANHELAQRLQISGTPTFVLGDGINGELLRGYLPADEMAANASRLRG